MTLSEARAIHDGDLIASKWDVPEYVVRRVTATWQDTFSQYVRARVASYESGGWIDLSRFVKCPRKHADGTPYRVGDVLDVEHRPVSESGQIAENRV